MEDSLKKSLLTVCGLLEKYKVQYMLIGGTVHPQTNDQIISYFKTASPHNYAEKCEIILDMSKAQFNQYEKQRQEWYMR